MNYAFFKLTGDLLGIRLIEPYERSGYRLEGDELAAWTADHYSEDHEGDVSVIDYWAEALHLSKWFQWRRFTEISHDVLHLPASAGSSWNFYPNGLNSIPNASATAL